MSLTWSQPQRQVFRYHDVAHMCVQQCPVCASYLNMRAEPLAHVQESLDKSAHSTYLLYRERDLDIILTSTIAFESALWVATC